MKKILADFYLDWFNNFLTFRSMASCYNITEDECRSLVDMGNKYHEERVALGKPSLITSHD